MHNKIIPILIVIIAIAIGSILLFRNNFAPETSAAVSRENLVLDLEFGNNDGSSTIYDTSGYSRHGTENGTPNYRDSYVELGNGADSCFSLTGTDVYNTTNVTIAIKFNPDFEASQDAIRLLYDASTSNRYAITKQAVASNRVLRIILGTTVVEDITFETYEQYWNVGEENIIVVRGTSGNTDVWLNGVQILTDDATAWTPKNPSEIIVGSYLDKVNYEFDGKLYYMKVWQRLLTDQEVAALNADRKIKSYSPSTVASSTAGSLIGHWTLDTNDVTASLVVDRSGKGNHGTPTKFGSGVTPTSTEGKVNQAVLFDSKTNDNGNITVDNFSTTDVVSYAAWLKVDTPGKTGFMTVVDNQLAGALNKGINIYINTDSSYATCRWDSGSAQVILSQDDYEINDGDWHHILCTKDGSDNYKVYTDGVLDNESSTALADTSSSDSFYIGMYNGLTLGFDGAIDEVKVWDYVLSADEVKNEYEAGKRRIKATPPSRTGLSLDLDMANNDGSSKVYDSSMLNHKATSTGAGVTFTDTHAEYNGAGGHYVNTESNGVFNSSELTIAVKFNPDLAAGQNSQRYLYDTTISKRYYVIKWGLANSYLMTVSMGGILIASIDLTTYEPYWNVGEENVLVVRSTSGDTDVWLNGNAILADDNTGWTLGNPSTFYAGAAYTSGAPLDGKLYYFKVWKRLLSDNEVMYLSKNRKTYFK